MGVRSDDDKIDVKAWIADERARLNAADEPVPIYSKVAGEETPDHGHTFRFTWCSRGSSKVVGDLEYHDSPQFNEDLAVTVEVRAWNLKAAIEKLGRLPFPVLMGHDESDEG